MRYEDVIKEQRKAISKLQDEIKLLKFDNAENLRKINNLKERLRRRNETVKNIRAELMAMKRKRDFSNINVVLAMLSEGYGEAYEE